MLAETVTDLLKAYGIDSAEDFARRLEANGLTIVPLAPLLYALKNSDDYAATDHLYGNGE